MGWLEEGVPGTSRSHPALCPRWIPPCPSLDQGVRWEINAKDLHNKSSVNVDSRYHYYCEFYAVFSKCL